MESSREIGKNFYIEVDQPPGHLFKDGDIVTGKCCLHSSVDEDIGSVTISFHGTVKVRFVRSDKSTPYTTGYSQNYVPSNYDSEDVLFSETRFLYQGPYTLRKNVLYEWPFQFQFPSRSSLPPSGTFRKDIWNSAVVAYELEACRRRKLEEAASVEKRITPVNRDRDANTHRTMFERIGLITGKVAIASLQVLPPKRSLSGPTIVPYRVERRLPARSLQLSRSHHHGLSGLFHQHSPVPDADCNIVVGLPQSLTQGSSIPLFWCIESSTDIATVSLHSLEVQLQVSKTVISKLGYNRKTDLSKLNLFSESQASLPLPTNCTVDIGKIFNLELDPNIVPTFSHPRVEVSYNLLVHLGLGCGGERLKEDFIVEDIQIMSNRNPNSPLRCDHLCVFSSESRQSNSAPPAYPGDKGQEDPFVGGAYLRLSRLLTQNFIPHSQVPSQTGEPTIILHGLPRLPEAPSLSSQPSPNPWSMDAREDALGDDMCLLDCILDKEQGYKATNMRTGRDALENFSFSWQLPTRSLKDRIRGGSTHLEILAADGLSAKGAEAPPPPYSTTSDPFSPIELLNKSLRHLASLQHSDTNIVSDIEYAITKFGGELRVSCREIDAIAARSAVALSEMLHQPLMDLGIDIDSNRSWSDEVGKSKEHQSWNDHHSDEKRSGMP